MSVALSFGLIIITRESCLTLPICHTGKYELGTSVIVDSNSTSTRFERAVCRKYSSIDSLEWSSAVLLNFGRNR